MGSRTIHTRTTRIALPSALSLLLLFAGCARQQKGAPALSLAPMLADPAQGDFAPVHDPSIIRQGNTFYVFTTDPVRHPSDQYLPIRCSNDKVTWKVCGQVFTAIPTWVHQAIPSVRELWAPDISFFNGFYHLYYAASIFGSQVSVIGLVTNRTLDPASPEYHWVDRGPVLTSRPGDDFNAIDPNILVDRDQRVWLTYGSYWSGIKQREVDPATGLLRAANRTRYSLAERPSDNAIEGPSLLRYQNFYYLFVSIGHCCESDIAHDDYQEAVGRSRSPHGPFIDAQGHLLTHGGGSILVAASGAWIAPGGGTAWLDPQDGEAALVFHALDKDRRGRATLWLKQIRWQNGWPVLD